MSLGPPGSASRGWGAVLRTRPQRPRVKGCVGGGQEPAEVPSGQSGGIFTAGTVTLDHSPKSTVNITHPH